MPHASQAGWSLLKWRSIWDADPMSVRLHQWSLAPLVLFAGDSARATMVPCIKAKQVYSYWRGVVDETESRNNLLRKPFQHLREHAPHVFAPASDFRVLLFVSHCWSDALEPDGHNDDVEQICQLLAKAFEAPLPPAPQLQKDDAANAQLRNLTLWTETVVDGTRLTLNKWGLSCRLAGRSFDQYLAGIGIWYDFCCTPQNFRHPLDQDRIVMRTDIETDEFKLSLHLMNDILSMCTVVLLNSRADYLKRAWPVVEAACASLYAISVVSQRPLGHTTHYDFPMQVPTLTGERVREQLCCNALRVYSRSDLLDIFLVHSRSVLLYLQSQQYEMFRPLSLLYLAYRDWIFGPVFLVPFFVQYPIFFVAVFFRARWNRYSKLPAITSTPFNIVLRCVSHRFPQFATYSCYFVHPTSQLHGLMVYIHSLLAANYTPVGWAYIITLNPIVLPGIGLWLLSSYCINICSPREWIQRVEVQWWLCQLLLWYGAVRQPVYLATHVQISRARALEKYITHGTPLLSREHWRARCHREGILLLYTLGLHFLWMFALCLLALHSSPGSFIINWWIMPYKSMLFTLFACPWYVAGPELTIIEIVLQYTAFFREWTAVDLISPLLSCIPMEDQLIVLSHICCSIAARFR